MNSCLPPTLTSFVGREPFMVALIAMLRQPQIRLVTLTGPGGVGKTRLALRIAEQVADLFPDGIWFVPLAAIHDPTHIAAAVADAVGVQVRGTQTAAGALQRFLESRRALLVLDNLEHLLAASPFITTLLTGSPRLTVLTTSRVVLRLSGEQVVHVPSLSLTGTASDIPSEAVRLFLDRASSFDDGFANAQVDLEVIASICHRLDGLPLAIELATARIGTLTPESLLHHLDIRLPLLTQGPRDAPPRLQTMRDAIAWSYDLLPMKVQTLYRRLSVFDGSWTLDGAAAVAWDLGESGLLDVVSALVDASLIQRLQRTDGDSRTEMPRFTMLETIREFGWECVIASGEDTVVREAHADYVCAVSERDGPGGDALLGETGADIADIRAALRYLRERGDVVRVLALASALGSVWQLRGYVREGRTWLEWALAHTPDQPTALRGRAFWALGLLVWSQGAYDDATTLARKSLAIAQACCDSKIEAEAIHLLGLVEEVQMHWDRAEPLLEQALACWQAFGDRGAEATTLFLLSGVAHGRGKPQLARARAEASRTIFAERQDMYGVASALSFLAQVARDEGNDSEAAHLYHEALALWREMDDRWWIVKALAGLAGIAGTYGQPEVGATLVGAVDAILEAVGVPIFPFDRVNRDRAESAARTALGDDRFARLYATGRALPLEKASAMAATVDTPQSGKAGLLTGRERQVLGLLAQGQTDQAIATQLFLSRRTVNAHVAHILTKFDVRSRQEAVTRARELGMLPV